MTENPETPKKPRHPSGRRMDWPNAIVVIALASIACWLVVAGLLIGVTGDGSGVLLGPQDIDMAPASGPEGEVGPDNPP